MLDIPREARYTVFKATPAIVDVAVPAMVGEVHVGWARVGIGQKVASEKLASLTRSGIVYALAAILIGSVIAWFMGRQITQRLYTVQSTIDMVRSGDRSVRSLLSGADEAAAMAREFNAMLDALAERDTELRASEEKYRSLIYKVPTAIVLHDGEGRILTANPRAQELLGLSEDQLLGKLVTDAEWHFLREDESLLPVSEYPVSLVLATRQPLKDYVTGVRRADRVDIVWTLVNAEPEYDEAGEIAQIVVSFVDITRRKQTERELEESRLLFQGVIEQSPIPMAFAKPTGEIFFNQACADHLRVYDEPGFHQGINLFEMKQPWKDYDAQGNLVSARDLPLAKALEGQTTRGLENRVVRKDGSERWEIVNGAPIYNKEGKLIAGFVAFPDITDLRSAESQMRILDFALNRVSESAFLMDEEAHFRYVNDEACRILGYSRHELLALSVWDVDPSLPPRPWQTHWEKLRASGSLIFEGHHKAKDGRIFPVEISANYFEFGGQGYNLALARDITERKEAEEALRESETKYRIVSDNTYDWEFWLGPDGKFIYTSPSCQQVTGHTAEEFIADPDLLDRIIHPEDRVVFGAHREGALHLDVRGERVEVRLNRPDGTMCWIQHACLPVFDSDGQFLGIRGSNRDITDRKQAEQERRDHLHFLESMDQINRAMQGTDDLEQMMSDVLEAILFLFDCDRVFLLYPCDPDAPTWHAPMERTKPEFPGALALGLEIPTDPDVAETFRLLLASDEPVKFGPGSAYPLPVDVSERFGFKCFMGMALHPRVGKPWQFGIHQCSYARVWTDEETRLFREIGRRLGDALSSLLARRNLQESEQRYRVVFENSPAAIWEEDFSEVKSFLDNLKKEGVADFEIYSSEHPETVRQCAELTRIVDVNQAAIALHEATSKEELLRSLLNTFTPASFETFRKELICLWNGGTEMTQDAVVKTLAGEPRDVTIRFSVCPGFEETLSKVLVSMADITERKRDEEEKSTLNDIFNVFLTAPDEDMYNGVLRVLLRVFDSPLGLFGYIGETGELVLPSLSREVWEACQVPEKSIVFQASCWGESLWGRAIREKRSFRSHGPFHIPAGHIHIKHFLAAPIVFGGETIGLISLANRTDGYTQQDQAFLERIANRISPILKARLQRDTQELIRRMAEAEIRRLNANLERRVRERTADLENANEELEAFTYSVSHDLRAPLRHLTGFVSLLAKRTSEQLDEKSLHYLDVISGSATEMGQLIDSILSFSRMGRVEMVKTPVDMNALVQEALAMVRHDAKGREIAWKIEQLPEVYGAADMLRLVVVNLLSNAVKFTAKKPQGIIQVGHIAGNEEDTLFVRDNGAGFDMRYVGKLFGLFQRLHRMDEFEGTGLGLANVRRIIHRHGGRAWAEGVEGEGATFYFSLPKYTGA